MPTDSKLSRLRAVHGDDRLRSAASAHPQLDACLVANSDYFSRESESEQGERERERNLREREREREREKGRIKHSYIIKSYLLYNMDCPIEQNVNLIFQNVRIIKVNPVILLLLK